MQKDVLQEQIQHVLRTTVMSVGVTNIEVNPITDVDGNPDYEVDSTVGDITMDDDTSAVIAKAVADAVVDFLVKEVVVKVDNAAAGAVTLTGYLE